MLQRFQTLCAVVVVAALCVAFVGCRNEFPTQAETGPTVEIGGLAAMKAVQRPIEEFVAAQGTFCFPDGMGGCYLFVPPVENYLGWIDPADIACASYDYAGLADEWITDASGGTISFGTTTRGSVTELPLPDGRAEVHVRLHTKNALTFAISDCADFGTSPLAFGHRATDVLAGADAALGDGFLHVVFIGTAPGAPLPDLIQLALSPEPGQELVMLSTNFGATGTLRAASGYPDGTAGRLDCVQTGLFFTGFHGATADGYPAEHINIRPVGGGQ